MYCVCVCVCARVTGGGAPAHCTCHKGSCSQSGLDGEQGERREGGGGVWGGGKVDEGDSWKPQNLTPIGAQTPTLTLLTHTHPVAHGQRPRGAVLAATAYTHAPCSSWTAPPWCCSGCYSPQRRWS